MSGKNVKDHGLGAGVINQNKNQCLSQFNQKLVLPETFLSKKCFAHLKYEFKNSSPPILNDSKNY